jgi:hypothetical protein
VTAPRTDRAGDVDIMSVAGPVPHPNRSPHRLPALGYLCVSLATTDAEVAELRRQLGEYATGEGLVLIRIFEDRRFLPTTGFSALFTTLAMGSAKHVVVPALHHFARSLGAQLLFKELLEKQTGAQVLVMYGAAQESA